jgi:endonuclease IV
MRRGFGRGARSWALGPLVIHDNYLINLASSGSSDADAFDSGVS